MEIVEVWGYGNDGRIMGCIGEVGNENIGWIVVRMLGE